MPLNIFIHNIDRMGHFALLGILADERLNQLIERIDTEATRPRIHSQGQLVIISGYTPRGEVQTYFYDTSMKGDVVEDLRPHFNGRMVIHEHFSQEYRCITDIVDDAPKERYGQWIVAGRSRGRKIAKIFRTKDGMIKGRESVFKEVMGMAIVHELGTTEYTLVSVKDWTYKDDDSVIIEPA